MPELPEVETYVREVRPRLVGRRIVRAQLSHEDVLRGVSRGALLAALRGSRVRGVFRRAKHAVIVTDQGRLVVQPGMTGSLAVLPRSAARAMDYAVLRAELDRGGELIYRDPRRLGTLLWLDDREWGNYTSKIGPEPLDSGFSTTGLGRILARSRAAVKKVLMDQGALAGVGNIYAQEALFAAGIDPSKPANQVSAEAAGRLYRSLRRILKAAIAAQGTTVRDYRTGSGREGGFQLRLKVYGREGEPCLRCGTILTGTHEIDGRTTVFCHRCQH
ncbi:MAG: bifunctional DNA-formamidopyrimidine glycosylase/DNA-(apurinic or apyrimidinic site) lyase [Gemmatimonadales bacterium]